MLTYILLILGFILLIKGADLFVDGSSSIARLLRIPAAVIGLTIVAFGTSAPELSVSCSAALAGQNEIAIRNVLGSDISTSWLLPVPVLPSVPFRSMKAF